MLKLAEKDASSTVFNQSISPQYPMRKHKILRKQRSIQNYTDRDAVTPCENPTLILSICCEVTHPLLRLLLTGSTFRPLGQRQDEERERIFVRPPLPGHESRGTSGVTTPDNQRGILNFHKVKAQIKK